MEPAPAFCMTIFDPVVASNLAVYLVRLPRSRTVLKGQSTAPSSVEFITLERAKEIRLGTQEDVWREITALRDTVFDIISYSGTRATPACSLWVLNELLDTLGWLTPYVHPLLPLARAHEQATGAVFVLGGRFNSAELYATPALFQQLWPKLLWAMTVEAIVEQKQTGNERSGTVPTKGEVTAWLAAGHPAWGGWPHRQDQQTGASADSFSRHANVF